MYLNSTKLFKSNIASYSQLKKKKSSSKKISHIPPEPLMLIALVIKTEPIKFSVLAKQAHNITTEN